MVQVQVYVVFVYLIVKKPRSKLDVSLLINLDIYYNRYYYHGERIRGLNENQTKNHQYR